MKSLLGLLPLLDRVLGYLEVWYVKRQQQKREDEIHKILSDTDASWAELFGSQRVSDDSDNAQ